jgi:hypothetical protein
MALAHELFDQVVDDALGAAVELRRYAFGERRDLRDPHADLWSLIHAET